jgi:hypothetical protein
MPDNVVVIPLQGGGKVAIPLTEPTIGDPVVVVQTQDGEKVAVVLDSLAVGDKVVVVPLQGGGKVAINLNPYISCPCCNWSWDGWIVFTNFPDSANFHENHGLIEFDYSHGSWVVTSPTGYGTAALSPPCLTKYNNLTCRHLKSGYCGFWKPVPTVLPLHNGVTTGMKKAFSTPVTITGFKIWMYCQPQIPYEAHAYVGLNGIYSKTVDDALGWTQVVFTSAELGGSISLSEILLYRYSATAANGTYNIYVSNIELEIGGSWVCFDTGSYP